VGCLPDARRLSLSPDAAISSYTTNGDATGLSDADIRRIEAQLANGDLIAALDVVDQALLVGECGMPDELVAHLRALWARLRDRRLARGKGSSKTPESPTLAA